ncbi:NADPH--cytochrome P450 reductase 1 [Picochlorum sp. SENEW3]|nr:NADPH--cytochrome P450 reductase 1 [Picochlorum sp. SENEW3]
MQDKDYVQHHIEKDGSHLWSLLSNKKNPGYLYICGDGKHMAKDVNRVLHHIVEKEEGCSGNQAEAIVKKMADQGRYLKDVCRHQLVKRHCWSILK